MMVVLVGCGTADPGWDGGGYTDEDDAAVDTTPPPTPTCEGAEIACPVGYTPGCDGGRWIANEWPPGAWACTLEHRSECRGGVPVCGNGRAPECIQDRAFMLADGSRLECP